MFRKILRRDLKRKKTMNILLLLFIILTAVMLGTGINMLVTNSTVVEHFMDQAKVADFTAITHDTKENTEKAKQWLSESKSVKDYTIETALLLEKSNIELPKDKKPFDYDDVMALGIASDTYNTMFDENDDTLTVKQGEIAIPYYFVDMTELHIGDKISVTIEGKKKELTISHYIKDAFCGADRMGYKRWIISEEDYTNFDTDKTTKISLLTANRLEEVEKQAINKEFNRIGIPSIATFDKDMIRSTYMINTLIACVIMVVSCLLIFISLLMLRFTIQFTIQEDYKEIGIMKAIGLKSRSIEGIYMVNYLAMGIAGGFLGYLISLYLGGRFMDIICGEMVMEATGLFNLPSLVGTALAILLILLYCRLCTRKLKKVSAIDAIRGGNTGERYHHIKGVPLRKWKFATTTYMAGSDLLHGMKKYVALFLSFILGTIVLIMPLNMVNTMRSPAILQLLGFSEFDFTIVSNETSKILFTYSTDELLSYVEELKKKYNDNGVPVTLYPEISYMCHMYKDDVADSRSIYTGKSYEVEAKSYDMQKGMCPELDNEVAVSTNVADYYNLNVGDSMHIQMGNEWKEYMVSGIYSSLISMGESVRLSPASHYSLEGSSGFAIMGIYQGDEQEETYMNRLTTLSTDSQVMTAQEYLHAKMGNVINLLDTVNTGILIIILFIIFLITVLVGKMILTKEIAEIAILKSLGYKNGSLKTIQIKRMVILLVVAVLLGTILANLLTGPVAKMIFTMMGASSLRMRVEPLQIFFIYPGIILICAILATLISSRDIKNIKVWELNNQE